MRRNAEVRGDGSRSSKQQLGCADDERHRAGGPTLYGTRAARAAAKHVSSQGLCSNDVSPEALAAETAVAGLRTHSSTTSAVAACSLTCSAARFASA